MLPDNSYTLAYLVHPLTYFQRLIRIVLLSWWTEGPVLKNFAIFAGKHLCRSVFLIKLQAFKSTTLLKRDSNTGVFLWILRNFQEHLFYKTSANDFFWMESCSRFFHKRNSQWTTSLKHFEVWESLDSFYSVYLSYLTKGVASSSCISPFARSVFWTLSNIWGGTFWGNS